MKLISKLFNELINNIEYFKLSDIFEEDNHKRYTELVIFLYYTNYLPKTKSNSSVRRLNELVNNEINKIKPDFIFRNFHFSFSLLMPYLLIRKQKKTSKLEKCLKVVLSQNFTSIEIPPHRELEISYFKNKIYKDTNINLPSNSILNNAIYLPHLNRELTYSYTHTLFYLIDFGFAEAFPKFLNYERIKFQVECLIIKSYKNGDIDILLELAINYFSLKNVTNINPSVLYIIEAALLKTNFIEFNWGKKKIVNEKYHSFLVLGMLCTLLEFQIKTFSMTTYSKKLSQIYYKSLLYDYVEKPRKINLDRIEQMKEFKIWDILTSTYSKKIETKVYRDLSKLNTFNEFLVEEILFNMNINLNRNEHNIHWDTEHKLLKLTSNRKLSLKNEYANIINRFTKLLKTDLKKHSPNIGIAASGAGR